MNVDGEGLQGGDVHDLWPLRAEVTVVVGPVQAVDADQKCSKGLAGTGWSRDQRVPAGGDLSPAASLRRGGPLRKPLPEPGPNGRMEGSDHSGQLYRHPRTSGDAL